MKPDHHLASSQSLFQASKCPLQPFEDDDVCKNCLFLAKPQDKQLSCPDVVDTDTSSNSALPQLFFFSFCRPFPAHFFSLADLGFCCRVWLSKI